MPKYYCRSGSYRIILDAKDQCDVQAKFINRLMKLEKSFSLLLTIGEQGFDNPNTSTFSLVPALKEVWVNIPSDEDLIANICECLGVAKLTEQQKAWILNGGDPF